MINETARHRTRRLVSIGFVAFLILVGAAIAVSAVFYALRSPTAPYPYFAFFPFGFGWFFGLFFLFFLFWGFRWWMWGGRWRYGPYRYWHHGDSAEAILRERYARGEIGKDQFEQMMRDLEQHS